MTITEVAMRRLRDSAAMAEVVIELADRWTRQEARLHSADSRHTLHDSGRMEGYVQAIGLMLGLSPSDTRLMLREGQFTRK